MLSRLERDSLIWQESPVFFLHTVHELLTFDRTVRDLYFSRKLPKRPGIVDTFCLNSTFLESWIAFKLDGMVS